MITQAYKGKNCLVMVIFSTTIAFTILYYLCFLYASVCEIVCGINGKYEEHIKLLFVRFHKKECFQEKVSYFNF